MVEIRQASTHADQTGAAAVLARIWGTSVDAAPLQADVLRSFVDAGASVLCAVDRDAVVGVTVAIAGAPSSAAVYSLIGAVLPEYAGQGLGLKLKVAQQDWALRHGADTIMWTYDPLISRNAHFNLNRLGARVTDHVPDFYPPMHDAINAGDHTDRFHVEWPLASPRPPREPPTDATIFAVEEVDTLPRTYSVPLDAAVVAVEIPRDIEALRRVQPEAAREWRTRTREVFTTLFGRGMRPVTFVGNTYLFARER